MPVQFAEPAGLQIENHSRDRFRNGKPLDADAPLASSLVDRMWLLRQQPVFVRIRRQLERTLQRGRRFGGRNGAFREIHLLLWNSLERRLGKAQVLRQQRPGSVSQPVGDAERSELREIAVVEDEDEMAGLVSQALNRV